METFNFYPTAAQEEVSYKTYFVALLLKKKNHSLPNSSWELINWKEKIICFSIPSCSLFYHYHAEVQPFDCSLRWWRVSPVPMQ